MGNPTGTDQLQQVANAQTAITKKEFAGKAGAQFIAEVKDSMLFHLDWADLLTAAPMALSLMGACWVAASSEEAKTIKLGEARPKAGWKHLPDVENLDLRAALVQVCNNGGREAFVTAGVNMEKLRGTSKELIEKVANILQALQQIHQPGMQDTLMDLLDELKDMSTRCLKYSDETEQGFNKWLLMVAELQVASEQKRGAVTNEAFKNFSEKAATEVEQSYTKDTLKSASDMAERMKTSLDKAEKAFEKANDDVPSAWENCLMTAINGFTQAGPALVAGALPLVLAAANPLGAVGMAMAGANQKGQKGKGGKKDSKDTKNGTAQPLATAPQTLAANSDPAYSAAVLVSAFFTTFYAYLTGGPKGTIDWAKFNDKGADDQTTGKSTSAKGLTWLITNLKMQKDAVDYTEAQPSIDLKQAFDDVLEIAEAVKAAVEKSTELSEGEVDEGVYKEWQKKVKSSKETIIRLEAVAKTAPGMSNSAPSIKPVKIDVPPTDYSAQNAALSAATQKLALNQQALNSAQENYEKAVAGHVKLQQAMANIEAKLKSLGDTEKLLTSVKAILVDCIRVLVDLKVQIGKIKEFFTAIHVMVEKVVMNHVSSFNVHVNRTATRSAKVGMLTINDLTRQMIFTSTLQINAYFDLLVDISRMYCQVHREHIVKGIELCDELSKGESQTIVNKKSLELQDYSRNARTQIFDLVQQRQSEINKGLKTRVANIAETTVMLEEAGVPMPDQGIQDAIREGAKVNTDQVQQGFDEHTSMVEDEELNMGSCI